VGPYHSSEETAKKIDYEIGKIIATEYQNVTKILKDNIDILNRMAERLIAVETMDSEEIISFFED